VLFNRTVQSSLIDRRPIEAMSLKLTADS
jgi:hypothetical protein